MIAETYPDIPGHKATTTETSERAADSMRPKSELLRDRCLAALEREELTADECAAEIGETVLATRPRFSELSAMGKIEPTSERRRNESGRSAVVWRVKRKLVQGEML